LELGLLRLALLPLTLIARVFFDLTLVIGKQFGELVRMVGGCQKFIDVGCGERSPKFKKAGFRLARA
jgi:hypothetical protein